MILKELCDKARYTLIELYNPENDKIVGKTRAAIEKFADAEVFSIAPSIKSSDSEYGRAFLRVYLNPNDIERIKKGGSNK